MADDVEFATPLSERDWDAALGGWRCSAVGIPGASVSLIVNGVRQDSERFVVSRSLRVIRWLGATAERPTLAEGAGSLVVAVVTLTKKLTPMSVPVIVALIGLVGTIGSALVTANLKSQRSDTMTTTAAKSGGAVPTTSTQLESSSGSSPVDATLNGRRDWAAQLQAASRDELQLARLGEAAYKDGEMKWAAEILAQADRVRITGASDPYVAYRVAALLKLNRYDEAQRALDKLVLRVNHAGSRSRAELTIRALKEVSDDVEYGSARIGPSIRLMEDRLKTLASD